MRAARRSLCLGIGGGGDVAGAFVLARALGIDAVVGGLSWERRTWDPLAGPRGIGEVENVRVVHRCAGLVGPKARLPGKVRCSEARMSAFLGGMPVALLDVGEGARAAAEGIAELVRVTGCDAVVLVDVGGDVLARGSEPGLRSPLADALGLATALWLPEHGLEAVGAVVGPGCDGELSASTVVAHLGALEDLGVRCARVPLASASLDEAEAAARAVGTEATTLALRCARGERGPATFRGEPRVTLTAQGGFAHVFDARSAVERDLSLARMVANAASIEEADGWLRSRGVVSELGSPGRRWTPSPARVTARSVI